jgi:trehalose synthase
VKHPFPQAHALRGRLGEAEVGFRSGLREIPLGSRSFDLIQPVISADAWASLAQAQARARQLLAGRVVWVVNSTAEGGGVAEMARTLLPYWRGCGIDARWLVVEGPVEFFQLTKRLHNMLYGNGAGAALGPSDQRLFESLSRSLSARAADLIAPGDLVLLQDPQTAGLVSATKRIGATVLWRCHVGADEPSAPVRSSWRFLLPYLEEADAFAFMRRAFVPPGIDRDRVHILAPAIDPCSAKNQPLTKTQAAAILRFAGLAQAPSGESAETVHLADGARVRMRRRCRVIRDGPPTLLARDRIVVALARWDRLKDPIGIVRAFAEHVDQPRTRLIVAGHALTAIADDPGAAQVFDETQSAWRALPADRRRRVELAVLPMADLNENALIVNALQRHAAIVLKKSLQEGFGLGVAEAMWKARPVIATRVGGHQDQIEHGKNGLLVDDPRDLAAFGAAINSLLLNESGAVRMGSAARESVRARFLADRNFVAWTAAGSSILSHRPATKARTSRAGGYESAPTSRGV